MLINTNSDCIKNRSIRVYISKYWFIVLFYTYFTHISELEADDLPKITVLQVLNNLINIFF